MKVYFKHKQNRDKMFSNEIFKYEPGVIFAEPPKINDKSDSIIFKTYHNINEIINDDNFIICTDDSFTKSDLKMIMDVVCAHGCRVYDSRQVHSVIHKIEKMLMTGTFLPEDKNEIIKK